MYIFLLISAYSLSFGYIANQQISTAIIVVHICICMKTTKIFSAFNVIFSVKILIKTFDASGSYSLPPAVGMNFFYCF